MFKILGTDDAVNTCDCCGKTNLIATVIVEVNGEVMHYGSVCATRHTGMKESEIKQAIKNDLRARKEASERAFKETMEYAQQEIAQSNARKAGLIGKAFRDACRVQQDAATAKAKEIATKFGVEYF